MLIITFSTKVGADNHNPVKTSNINRAGATPQIFCKVCVIAEPKKLIHRPGKIPLRKHVNVEKGQNSDCFLFSPVKIDPCYFLKFHFHFPQNPDPYRIPGPGQLSKVKSRPPGQVFGANPGGCPGGCTQLELTETLDQIIY